MNRKEYSKQYNESKQLLRDAIKRFAQENPLRYTELQAQARNELYNPKPKRSLRELSSTSHSSTFDVDEYIRQHHKQDYFITTKERYGKTHLYFETLGNETPEEVLTRRHSRFTERGEVVTNVEKCQCSLCLHLK